MKIEEYLNSVVELFITKYGIKCAEPYIDENYCIISQFILLCTPRDFREGFHPDYHIELDVDYLWGEYQEDEEENDEVDYNDLSKWTLHLAYNGSDCQFLDCWNDSVYYNLGKWTTDELVKNLYEEHLSHVYEEYFSHNLFLAAIEEECSWLIDELNYWDNVLMKIPNSEDDWDIINYYEFTSIEQVENTIKNKIGCSVSVSVKDMYEDVDFNGNDVIMIKIEKS